MSPLEPPPSLGGAISFTVSALFIGMIFYCIFYWLFDVAEVVEEKDKPSPKSGLTVALIVGIVVTLFLTGCSSDSPVSPSAVVEPPRQLPPTTVVPPVQQPPLWSLSGAVRGLVDSEPVPATISVGGVTATADASGAFRLESVVDPSGGRALNIEAPGYVPRQIFPLNRSGSLRNPITMISTSGMFSLDFYNAFVRNAPASRTSILRWDYGNPNFYIQTGGAMGRSDVPVIEEAIRLAVGPFTGGKYQPGEIRIGDEDFSQTGWITIKAVNVYDVRFAGRAFVGANPGTVTVNAANECGDEVGIGTVIHELGHALGFWHVQGTQHAMHPIQRCGPAVLSDQEAFHAWVAYQRPRGNMAPDSDPSDFRSAIGGAGAQGAEIMCPL